MNSLFAKILAWFWGTLAITLVGSAFISAISMNPTSSDARSPGARLVRFHLEEAREAYETGGRPDLQAFLETLNRIYDAQGVLTDERGRDLLTNQDRSGLLRRARLGAPGAMLYRFVPIGNVTLARASADGRYWFFFIVPRTVLAPSVLTPGALVLHGCGSAALLLAGVSPDEAGAGVAEGRGTLRTRRFHRARELDTR